jgi:preprotein translocase subunit SecG
MVDEGVVAVFISVLVQTNDSEDVLHIFGVDHDLDDTFEATPAR